MEGKRKIDKLFSTLTFQLFRIIRKHHRKGYRHRPWFLFYCVSFDLFAYNELVTLFYFYWSF